MKTDRELLSVRFFGCFNFSFLLVALCNERTCKLGEEKETTGKCGNVG